MLRDLLWQHKFADVVTLGSRLLTNRPDDLATTSCVAKALRALGRYGEALPYFERLDAAAKSEDEPSGRPGRQLDIACLHWMLGEQAQSIVLVEQLVDGILDGAINYADIAGGVSQGLLLYYMGVTAQDEAAKAKALSYLRDRTTRSAAKIFPGPVAGYYLDEVDFSEVLVAATANAGSTRDVGKAVEAASHDLLTRRFVCVALFHDGVKARASGDEVKCMQRMQICSALEDPLIEHEWYLARWELRRKTSEW